jgi:hypothetical protein
MIVLQALDERWRPCREMIVDAMHRLVDAMRVVRRLKSC